MAEPPSLNEVPEKSAIYEESARELQGSSAASQVVSSKTNSPESGRQESTN